MDYETVALSYLIAVGIVSLAICIICGKVAENIAINKGYGEASKTYFWLGFFVTVIGIIIISVQPDKRQAEQKQRISSADDLLNYKKLLDEGVISQEEFNRIKQRML